MEFFKENGVDIVSKLPGLLMQVHRLRTECWELKERAAAMKLEKMLLGRAAEREAWGQGERRKALV